MDKKQTEAEKKKQKWLTDNRKAYGGNIMDHGYITLPSEYDRFLWAFSSEVQKQKVTLREMTTLRCILGVNTFDREVNHEPVYITQEELGAQMGITHQAVSKILKGLRAPREFQCPFCDYTKVGYIRVEEVKPKQGELQPNNIWTDGFKGMVNHLAGHYNKYMTENGFAGQEMFKQDRDRILRESKPEWRKQLGTQEKKGDF